MKFFTVETDSSGVTLVTFSRPPVNALSYDVYREIRQLSEMISASDDTRVAIVTAPDDARAWCGGADLNDILPLDHESRLERYALINECIPAFYHLDRPVIAALNAPAIGVGVVLASFCDIRVAAEEAFFASPEIDRGVLAGGGAFYARLNMPQGIIRELTYTGRRFTAREMKEAGFLNYVVPKAEVLPKAREIAALIAAKSLPALRATKRANNQAEGMDWQSAYRQTNSTSADLTVTRDAKEGIRSFLESRDPQYSDS